MGEPGSVEELEKLLALPEAREWQGVGGGRAISLSRFVQENAVPRDSEPLPFPHAVRCLAWTAPILGLVSLLVYAKCGSLNPDAGFFLVGRGLLASATTFAHHPLVGIASCGALVGASSALAAGTSLYRHGPAWSHVAAVVAAIVGLVLFAPVGVAAGVIVANLALWIVIAIAVAAVAIFLAWVLLMAAVDSLFG